MLQGQALESTSASGMAPGAMVCAQQIEIKYPRSASSRDRKTSAADTDRNAG